MVKIFGHKIKGLPFLIAFVITIIFFVVVFDIVGIPINQNLTIAIFGFGLMSGGLVSIWMKGILHQGHFSIVVGLIFIVIGGAVLVIPSVLLEYFTKSSGIVSSHQIVCIVLVEFS